MLYEDWRRTEEKLASLTRRFRGHAPQTEPTSTFSPPYDPSNNPYHTAHRGLAMSFSILLAHFCDKHGPRSIMCTQNASDAPENFTLSDFSKESYCQSCLLVFPKREPSRPSASPLLQAPAPTTTMRTTYKDQVYTTTQYSAQKFRQLNSIVRKCLSEETTIYDSRPMYFGDEVRGHSLTQSFKIKDLEARGSERRYSFIINCENEQRLLSNWDLIVEHTTVIIDSLIERRKEFELASSTNNEIFLRGKLMQSKSLTELLGDEQLFVKIHLWNSKLLQKLNNA